MGYVNYETALDTHTQLYGDFPFYGNDYHQVSIAAAAQDVAQQAHSEIYPPPFDSRKFDPRLHPCLVLAVAAAFEGLHYWEHDQWLIGECIDSQSARQSLKDVVTRDVERLVNAADPKVEVDPVHLEELVNQATEEAFYLFETHYRLEEGEVGLDGNLEEKWYDPKQMAPHESMAGEWRGWACDVD